jgi:hypothetical protein
VAVPWIGLAGSVFAAHVAGAVAWRQANLSQRQAEMANSLARSQAETERQLARLASELSVEQHEPEAPFERGLHTADVLATCREPLGAAAFDLQSRIYHILRLDFFAKWETATGDRTMPSPRRCSRLAPYFGRTEILWRKIQFSFPEDDESRKGRRASVRYGAVPSHRPVRIGTHALE